MTTMIDMTPTFREATAICIGVLENCAAQDRPSAALLKAAQDCKVELMRYAAELDRLKAQAGTGFDAAAADTPVEG